MYVTETKKRRGSIEEASSNDMMYLPKKPRVCFSEDQREMLRQAYLRDPYPNQTTIEQLADTLGVGVKTVVNWFHNHRMRAKQQQHFAGQSPTSGQYDSSASVKSEPTSDDSNSNCDSSYETTPVPASGGNETSQWLFPTFEIVQPGMQRNSKSSDEMSQKDSEDGGNSDCDSTGSNCEMVNGDTSQSQPASSTTSRRKSAKPMRIAEGTQMDQTSISSDSERCDSHPSVDLETLQARVTPDSSTNRQIEKIQKIQKALASSEMEWEEPDRAENIQKLQKSITSGPDNDWPKF